ncbi:MAG: helix-hairpin-helix domain-containing protein [Bacteroidota bacterium]
MIKFLLKAISRSTGFSKTESKGTLVLILILLSALVASNYRIRTLKKETTLSTDSLALNWVKEVASSYQLKKQSSEKTQSAATKSVTSTVARSKKPNYVKPKTSPETNQRKTKSARLSDLNLATAEELQKVKGIGKVFSERIVKYRSMLGGFNDSTQLSEVYGLENGTIDELLKSFSIQSPVKPLIINTDSIRLLASHPYISYDLARVIISYRAEHGDIDSPEELKKIKAIDERTFLRISPYLE